MDLVETVARQMIDPFRIGLIVALVATMLRTERATGRALPLALGVGFVAVIVPMTLGGLSGVMLWREVVAGIVANAAILAVVLAARHLLLRFRR